MSSTPPQTAHRAPQRNTTERTTECDQEISTLLSALEDDDCRAILEATSETARTAGELCEMCGLSSSTAYRKIDRLTETGLFEESVRLSRSGSHKSEYKLAVQGLELSLDSGIELSLTARCERPQPMGAD